MLKNIIVTASLSLVATAVSAADMPSKTVYRASTIANNENWSGFYVGLQAGLSQNHNIHSDINGWFDGLKDAEQKKVSPAVGVKSGYDHRFGSVIAGVVSEVKLGNFKAGGQVTPYYPSYDLITRSNYLGSARGKLGVGISGATISNTALSDIALYATAGVAFSNSKHRLSQAPIALNNFTFAYYSENGKNIGWVAGLGIDYAISSKTSVGLELSHYEFGSLVHDLLNNAGASNGYRIKQSNSHDTLTVNVTQHF